VQVLQPNTNAKFVEPIANFPENRRLKPALACAAGRTKIEKTKEHMGLANTNLLPMDML